MQFKAFLFSLRIIRSCVAIWDIYSPSSAAPRSPGKEEEEEENLSTDFNSHTFGIDFASLAMHSTQTCQINNMRNHLVVI